VGLIGSSLCSISFFPSWVFFKYLLFWLQTATDLLDVSKESHDGSTKERKEKYDTQHKQFHLMRILFNTNIIINII